jgi:hypothetical protein
MMRESTSLRTTFFGIPIPEPVMTDRIGREFTFTTEAQRTQRKN